MKHTLVLLLLAAGTIVACGTRKRPATVAAEPAAYTPFTISDADLPSLAYIELDTLSCFPLPKTGVSEFRIVRHGEKYYLGMKGNVEKDFSLREITPNASRHFRLDFSATGKYYFDLAESDDRLRGWSRRNTLHTQWGQRVIHEQENVPDYNYPDYREKGRPAVAFDTKAMEKAAFISLDSLWNLYRLQEYHSDRPGAVFHVLPARYKNHDLVIERNGDRYLLYRLDLTVDEDPQRRTAYRRLDEEPLLDLSPRRRDPLTGEMVTRQFTVFENNIIVVSEQRERGGFKRSEVYSISPYYHTPQDSRDDQIAYFPPSTRQTYLTDGTADPGEAAAARDFLRWMADNHRALQVDAVDMSGPYYKVNMAALDRLLDVLRGSGLVTERFLRYWADHFDEARRFYEENRIDDGPPDYFDYDLLLSSQEPDDILAAIRSGHTVTTSVRRIAPDRSIVTVTAYYQDLTYELVRVEGRWLIDRPTTTYGDWFVADEPTVVLMADDEEELLRMLDHHGLEQEDRYYFELIEEAAPNFRAGGVAVDIFDPKRYGTVEFPDGTRIDLADFYYFDALLYRPGKAPQVISNVDRRESWPEIGVYFGRDDDPFNPRNLRIQVDL